MKCIIDKYQCISVRIEANKYSFTKYLTNTSPTEYARKRIKFALLKEVFLRIYSPEKGIKKNNIAP